MPNSPSDYTGSVRYNDANTHVICRHCRAEIERGSDYAVLLSFPDDVEKVNKIGPYCNNCMPKLKVCCDCNMAHFGEDEIRYFQNGIYYCTDCASSKDICAFCGETHDISIYKGKKICKGCFDKHYFECGKCHEMHEKGKGDATAGTTLNQAMYSNMVSRWGTVCDDCFFKMKPRYKAKKVKECTNCSEIYSGKGSYCKSCISNLPKCDMCNSTVHKYQTLHDRSRDITVTICHNCKPNTCDGCGLITMDKLVEKRGIFDVKTVCPSCNDGTKNECKHCLQYKLLDDDGVCSSCKAIFSSRCNHCDEVVIEGNSSRCRACHEDYAGKMNYSYRPIPLFHYTDKDVIEGDNCFMGFEDELTVAGGERSVLKAIYASGLNPTKMSAKSDGSISGPGFEMVSHPYTLRAIKAEKVDALFVGTKAHESCGMHIHFDRRCLSSDTHLYKLISFIHENESFADAIAGRKFTGYQKKINKKVSKVVKDKQNNQRYQRVNLQNEATVEIRMFASTDRKYKFYMRLEFVHALVNYTRSASIKACKNYAGFIHYVSQHKRKYNNLHKFLGGSQRAWNNGEPKKWTKKVAKKKAVTAGSSFDYTTTSGPWG